VGALNLVLSACGYCRFVSSGYAFQARFGNALVNDSLPFCDYPRAISPSFSPEIDHILEMHYWNYRFMELASLIPPSNSLGFKFHSFHNRQVTRHTAGIVFMIGPISNVLASNISISVCTNFIIGLKIQHRAREEMRQRPSKWGSRMLISEVPAAGFSITVNVPFRWL